METKAISIDEASDAIVNETVNTPERSMKGLLLLFYELYAAGLTFNPDITAVKVVVNEIPNKGYSQGMKGRDTFEEVFRRFEKENSAMKTTEFYVGDILSLFIDLRSMRDNDLHGSGLR